MAEGWKAVFDKHSGIKVLEGPVDTNWDPAEAQRVMAGMLAKYPQIDAVMSDYGLGSMGALRAFVAAGRKIPLWPGQDANQQIPTKDDARLMIAVCTARLSRGRSDSRTLWMRDAAANE